MLACSVGFVLPRVSFAPVHFIWGPKNDQNNLKSTVWAFLGRPFLGDPSGPSKSQKHSHAARHSFFFKSECYHAAWRSFCIFWCSLWCPMLGPTRASETLWKQCFLLIFQMKGTLGAATKCIPKSKKCKICKENKCFVRLPWELFGVHLGWSIFWCAQLGCSNGTPEVSRTY